MKCRRWPGIACRRLLCGLNIPPAQHGDPGPCVAVWTGLTTPCVPLCVDKPSATPTVDHRPVTLYGAVFLCAPVQPSSPDTANPYLFDPSCTRRLSQTPRQAPRKIAMPATVENVSPPGPPQISTQAYSTKGLTKHMPNLNVLNVFSLGNNVSCRYNINERNERFGCFKERHTPLFTA